MAQIVFLGSRNHVYTKMVAMNIPIQKIYAFTGSPLAKHLDSLKVNYTSFDMSMKEDVLDELIAENYDILVSNGCPILFPVDRFADTTMLLNVHPTYLPHLRGKTPLNGIYYLDYDFYGATMHYINRGVDKGRIIYQEKYDLTDDLDLGLLYHLSLKLEGDVFEEGWKRLVASGFAYQGEEQEGKGSYFNRTPEQRQIDWSSMDTKEIMRKIRSFGVSTQGSIAILHGHEYLIFDAEKILNPELLQQAKTASPGQIVLEYDNKLLVKTLDGLLKIRSFRPQN